MPPAIQLALLPEVDQVHQQLVAGAAHEAARVPQLVVPGAFRKNGRVAATHAALAVMTRLRRQRI